MSAPAGGGLAEVLAVLDSLLALASRGVEADDQARPMIEAAHDARAAIAELIEAGQRVTAAFRAIGSSPTLGAPAGLRAEAEAAMLALDAALAKVASNGDTK